MRVPEHTGPQLLVLSERRCTDCVATLSLPVRYCNGGPWVGYWAGLWEGEGGKGGGGGCSQSQADTSVHGSTYG